MTIFGYACASTSMQSLDEQLQEMSRAGVEPQNIFTDEPIRRHPEPIGLTSLKNTAKAGDIIIVTRLGRFGRDITESIHLIQYFNDKEIALRFIDDGFSTENSQGTIVLAVLTAVDRAERRRIQERTREGRIEAKGKGVKFGRKPSVDRDKVQMMRLQGTRASEIARQMKIGRSTVYKILQSLL
jgi:DNA invertase Pin-like site-specific DNA recombinase